METRGNAEGLRLQIAHDVEATIAGRGRVIRMTLQFCAKLEEVPPLERPPGELVQPMKKPEPNGDAAAEPAGLRNLTGYRRGKGKGTRTGALEKTATGRARHRPRRLPSRAPHVNVVVKTQSDPETIKTRAQVRCARRHADGDLMHGGRDPKPKREPIPSTLA